MRSLQLTTIFILVLFSFPTLLFPQMPGWVQFRDLEGNRYYIDKGGKIHASLHHRPLFKPVSEKNAFYSSQRAHELYSRKPIEALFLIKSLLALPDTNERIYTAKKKAVSLYNKMKGRGGIRFSKLNESMPIAFHVADKKAYLNHDKMYYSLILPGNSKILTLKRRKSPGYRYSGLKIGIAQKKQKGPWDMLCSIDSEEYSVSIKSLKEVEKIWHRKLVPDTFIRKEIIRDKYHVINEFSAPRSLYKGYEAIYFNNEFCHIVRIICPGKKFTAHKETMEQILSDFKTVRGRIY